MDLVVQEAHLEYSFLVQLVLHAQSALAQILFGAVQHQASLEGSIHFRYDRQTHIVQVVAEQVKELTNLISKIGLLSLRSGMDMQSRGIVTENSGESRYGRRIHIGSGAGSHVKVIDLDRARQVRRWLLHVQVQILFDGEILVLLTHANGPCFVGKLWWPLRARFTDIGVLGGEQHLESIQIVLVAEQQISDHFMVRAHSQFGQHAILFHRNLDQQFAKLGQI